MRDIVAYFYSVVGVSQHPVSSQNATVASMTNHTDVVPPTPELRRPVPPSHAQRAEQQIVAAYGLDDAVARYRARDDHPGAGRIQALQRAHMKRAEVHALMAIAGELSRIGLAQ